MSNFHIDPRLLIVEAAERSGLLKEVANLIWFANQHGSPGGLCPICALVDELTEAFDQHICTPAIVGEDMYGGGFEGGPDISPRAGTEDEAAFETFYAGFCKPDQTKLEGQDNAQTIQTIQTNQQL